jgi:hypothetical protein
MALGVFEYEYGDRGVRAGAGFGRGTFLTVLRPCIKASNQIPHYMSPRIGKLKAILDKLRPAPIREPVPAALPTYKVLRLKSITWSGKPSLSTHWIPILLANSKLQQ